jgi:arylsulfatase A-like enzyme
LKLVGKFDEYAKHMYAKNHLDALEQTEKEFDTFVEHGFESFMSEMGEVEKWDGNNISPEQIKETKAWIAEQKKKISTYLS